MTLKGNIIPMDGHRASGSCGDGMRVVVGKKNNDQAAEDNRATMASIHQSMLLGKGD
jgi:hypothetical protein